MFDPAKDWVAKKHATLKVQFDGDTHRTKVALKTMLEHSLSVAALTQVFSDDESSDEDVPVNELARPSRAAAKTARAAVQAAVDSSDKEDSSDGEESWYVLPSPIRGAAADSSLDSSPFASPVAGARPSPRRSPRNRSPSPPPPRLAHDSPESGDSSDEELAQTAAMRKDYAKVYTKTTKDKKQPAKTLDWSVIDHTKIKVDARNEVEGNFGTDYPALLLNEKEPADSVYKMWKHLTPKEWLAKLAKTANTQLEESPIDKNYRKTTPAEVEAVLGLALAAAVHGSGPFDTFFSNSGLDANGLFASPHFGRFGINKNRAVLLLRIMHLSDGPMQPAGEDPYWFVDGPLDEYNATMKMSMRPSHLGTMDESGPAWRGGEGEGNFFLCPHVTVCKRKPEPVCAQFNDSGCAKSKVMMKVEYEKAAPYHAATKYMDSVGTYNASMTVRLSEPWRGTNAVVYGDSRFGSVKAAYFNRVKLDVHSIFDIKTGTSLFPRAELIKMCGKEHGSLVVMKATLKLPNGELLVLYAIAQRRGPSVHTFLSTCGSFVEQIPSRFHKINTIADAPWTTPAVLNTVTAAQPMVDVVNRTLFDQLGMHDTFVTRCFETRFSLHFMLPLTYVNAVNASKYFYSRAYPKDVMTKSVLLELASHMARNRDWLEQLNVGKPPPPGPSGTRAGTNFAAATDAMFDTPHVSINGGPPSRESPCKHLLIPLSQLEGYTGAKQQRCWECDILCSWACVRCSNAHNFIALHPPVCQGSKRQYGCLAAHRRNPGGNGYKDHHEQVSGTCAGSKRRRKIAFVHL